MIGIFYICISLCAEIFMVNTYYDDILAKLKLCEKIALHVANALIKKEFMIN